MGMNQEDRNTSSAQSNYGRSSVMIDFLGCSYRATVRLIKGLPSRFVNFVKRKIKEYRNRPKRKDISRVYVVVGYTTKKRGKHARLQRTQSEKLIFSLWNGRRENVKATRMA